MSTFVGSSSRIGEVPSQRGRTFLKILVVLTGAVGVIACLLFAASTRSAAGGGLALFYALIPLPFLVLTYWWLDRVEPEPLRYKWAAFVWGGVVAVAVALLCQVAIINAFDLDEQQAASWLAPITEEPVKGLFLVLTFARARHVIDGVVDGLVYAGIVGIGFAFMENIGFYASSYLGTIDESVAGASGATGTFIVRGIVSPLAHPLFTSAFGIALGLAVMSRSWFAKIVIASLGMLGSILLHALWNSSLSYGGVGGFLLVYLLLACFLAALAATCVIARIGQLQTLERSLTKVADRGWLPAHEVPYLVGFARRRYAVSYAKSIGGPSAAEAMKRYQSLATEMGFLHHAVVAGQHKPRGIERTYRLLDAMEDLRRYTFFPIESGHAGYLG